MTQRRRTGDDEREPRERRAKGAGGGSFRCAHCGFDVPASAMGTQHRNHCPRCLWSMHVDEAPGDRRAACGGQMEPIAMAVLRDEWALVHRCMSCMTLKLNRVAGDDSPVALLALAAKPLANPPFPLDFVPM